MPTNFRTRVLCAMLLVLTLTACTSVEPQGDPMDAIAESFVKLVLAVGQHDADYVDAYFGPEAWQVEARDAALGLEEIRRQAVETLESL